MFAVQKVSEFGLFMYNQCVFIYFTLSVLYFPSPFRLVLPEIPF